MKSSHQIGKFLYLSQVDPYQSIIKIKHRNDITKELWLKLDKERNLDAKWYLLRYFVFDDEQYVKDVLGTKKKFDQLSMEDLYKISHIFKKELGIHQHDEQTKEEEYAISSYAEKGYIDSLKTGKEPLILIKEHEYEDSHNEIPMTNSIIGQDHPTDQTINGYPIKKLFIDFFQNDSTNFYKRIQQSVKIPTIESIGGKNLYKYIEQKTELKNKNNYLDSVALFLNNSRLIAKSVEAMYTMITQQGRIYDTIKNTLNKQLTHTMHGAYTFHDTDIKDHQRTFEKLIMKYDGDMSSVKDIVRCTFSFKDLNSLVGGIQTILKSLHTPDIYEKIKQTKEGKPLVEIEDKIGLLLKEPLKSSGYRDITIVIHFRGQEGLIPMEIQLHLDPMYQMKTQGVQEVYKLIEDKIGQKTIELINELLINKGSTCFLPTNSNETISSDQIYRMRRLFQEDKKNQKLGFGLNTIVTGIIDLFGGTTQLNNQGVADILGSIESLINNYAWLQVLKSINLPKKGFYTLPGTIESSNSRFGSQIENNLSK
ncbi:MAG TPA: hypothetical protein PK048_00615 [Candidatus Absconditabacterales bacterium]|nr:hypothetical protein [Candidatus Absconditabacterales bacterium]